jgi:hypothetical protein
VSDFVSLPPAERFILIMKNMMQEMGRGARIKSIAAPLLILIWQRLHRIKFRFIRAATTPQAPARPARKRIRPNPIPLLRLPRGKAWLIRLIPESAGARSQLCHWLNQPDAIALINADPRLGRILRPLCHALKIGARLAPSVFAAPEAAPPQPITLGSATPDLPPYDPPAPHPVAPIQRTDPPATWLFATAPA